LLNYKSKASSIEVREQSTGRLEEFLKEMETEFNDSEKKRKGKVLYLGIH